MYVTVQRHYYSSNMASNVFKAGDNCHNSAKTGNTLQHKRYIQLFTSTLPSESVAIDILDLLSMTAEGSQHALITTDRFSKLTRAVSTAKTIMNARACIFFDALKISNGVPSYLLTDNGTQFFSNFFDPLCTHLGTIHMTTTVYHPQTSGQVER